MGRLEKYREIRKNKKKLSYAVALFMILLCIGIITADNELNLLMGGNKSGQIIHVGSQVNDVYSVNFLGKSIDIDINDLKNSINAVTNNIKDFFSDLFGRIASGLRI